MTMTTEMKTHDLKPDLTLYPEDASQVADLRGVVSWRVIATMHGVPVFTDTGPAVTVNPATPWKATLVHQWQAGETANAGDMRVEAEATWPTGKPQTFPPGGYVTVRLNQDLG